jgi:hypothetical protein
MNLCTSQRSERVAFYYFLFDEGRLDKLLYIQVVSTKLQHSLR